MKINVQTQYEGGWYTVHSNGKQMEFVSEKAAEQYVEELRYSCSRVIACRIVMDEFFNGA